MSYSFKYDKMKQILAQIYTYIYIYIYTKVFHIWINTEFSGIATRLPCIFLYTAFQHINSALEQVFPIVMHTKCYDVKYDGLLVLNHMKTIAP